MSKLPPGKDVVDRLPREDASRKKGELPDWRAFVRKRERRELTLAEVWALYLAELVRAEKPSARTYVSTWRTVIEPAFGALDVRDIEGPMVQAWVEAQRQVPYAPKSIRRHASQLRCLLDYAVEIGAADENVIRSLPSGWLPPNRVLDEFRAANEVFDLETVRRLLESDEVPFDRRAFYALGFLTGARYGESAGLQWQDYSPARKPLGELLIRRSWDCKAHRFGPTKTGRVAHVPVHPRLAAMLEETRVWWRDAFGRDPEPTDLILPRAPLNSRQRHAIKMARTALDAANTKQPVRRRGPAPTVAAFRATWLESLRQRGLHPSTIRMSRYVVERHVRGSSIDSLRLDEVGREHLDQLWRELADVPRSTRRHVRTALNGIFRHALDAGLIGSTPTHKVPYRRAAPVDDEPRPRSNSSVNRWWKKDLAAIGVEPLASGPHRIHAMRHTMISQLWRAGVSTARVFTHSAKPRDAHELYVHLDWATLCDAILRLEI